MKPNTLTRADWIAKENALPLAWNYLLSIFIQAFISLLGMDCWGPEDHANVNSKTLICEDLMFRGVFAVIIILGAKEGSLGAGGWHMHSS